MKHWFMALLAVVSMAACKTQQTESETPAADIQLPYTLEKPYNEWQIGKTENVRIVMSMIRAWETKDLTQCATFFADTTELSFDGYNAVLPHDSIPGFLDGSWTGMAGVQILMQDYESVVSKDQQHEWVTLWYKQIITDDKGNKDSLNLINDAKIENGKITIFSEYVQHFPDGKK